MWTEVSIQSGSIENTLRYDKKYNHELHRKQENNPKCLEFKQQWEINSEHEWSIWFRVLTIELTTITLTARGKLRITTSIRFQLKENAKTAESRKQRARHASW